MRFTELISSGGPGVVDYLEEKGRQRKADERKRAAMSDPQAVKLHELEQQARPYFAIMSEFMNRAGTERRTLDDDEAREYDRASAVFDGINHKIRELERKCAAHHA